MNDFNPSFTDQGNVPLDNLLASDNDINSRSVVQNDGEDNTKTIRGALMGRIFADTLTPTAHAGNTGNGTFGAITPGSNVKEGTYTVKLTAATVFDIYDPDGEIVLKGQATGAAFATSHLNGTLTAGGAAFVAGDSFTIAVSGSGKYKLATLAATDGSQFGCAILAQDTDSSAADATTLVYESGTFNESQLTLGTGITITNTLRDSLRKRGIFLKLPVSAT